jgi:hypothetical protein
MHAPHRIVNTSLHRAPSEFRHHIHRYGHDRTKNRDRDSEVHANYDNINKDGARLSTIQFDPSPLIFNCIIIAGDRDSFKEHYI